MVFAARLKAYVVAILSFLAALFTAAYYRGKTKQLQKRVKIEQHKAHNLEAQYKAAMRARERHDAELKDALKDDSYLDYFDRKP